MIEDMKRTRSPKPTKQRRRRAGDVAVAALRRCGRDIRAALPAARLGEDPEALHHLRVAVRRARAVLGQYAIALEPDGSKLLAKHLRWLGRTTALTRDLDVLAQAVAGWMRDLDAADRRALAALWATLDGARQRSHEGLRSSLQSPRMADALVAFGKLRPSATGLATTQSAATLGAARCAQTLRRLSADIATIDAGHEAASDASLHAVRIVVKKARYRLQLQRELSDATRGRKLLRTLTKLQAALGRLQDAAVGQRRLASLALPADAQATVAAGRLLERIDAARHAAAAEARALLPKVRRRADKVAARLDRLVADEVVDQTQQRDGRGSASVPDAPGDAEGGRS